MGHQFFFYNPNSCPHVRSRYGEKKKSRNVSRAGFLHIFLPERDEELHTTIISRLQFIPQSGPVRTPTRPPPHPRPLRACYPPDDTSGDPGNPQFCLTAPALPMILDPITGTFNIYSTSALHSIQYVSHFASRAFPSPGRMALHSTQLTHTLIPSLSKHYLLFLFAIILPLWSSRTLETHSAMGGNSHW